ncbi:MAG: phenylalanine--tRNA ligase subunit beta, partial [Candidatus Falkowbacteria bacterium]|nr:phenylalanine--tRNA ligase subunit beta [Candidatus Falkowbacteria bacterium]
MFLSLNWLREYVDIPNNISVPDLTSLLNLHVVEVDNVINQENQFKNIVVGKILSIEEHPNADKLKKAVVNVGKEKLEIVCGAPNIKKGQLVPVALIGAIMPDGMEIKETLIRGEKSFGMLCSQRELKLGDDHSGILILDDSAKVGQLISDFLELNDCIFEIDNKSLTNRPDLWGYLGMAREIAIITKGKLKDVSVKDLTIEAKAPINVSVLSAENCPRYMALQIDNIKIEDSPWWLKKKLITSGLKPINNIVDITNYIMLETAQPMHAFNADSIMVGDIEKEIKIIVRMAEPGESIQSLDGEKRELSEMDIVIANRDELLAVAGVMGGAKSQITNSTKSIILESANFNPIAVRKTSKKLGLRTESSIRFEKGLDPSMAEIALNRAVNLLASLDKEARIVASADVKNYAQQLSVIKLELAWLQKRLGDLITFERVKEILEALGFGVKSL